MFVRLSQAQGHPTLGLFLVFGIVLILNKRGIGHKQENRYVIHGH